MKRYLGYVAGFCMLVSVVGGSVVLAQAPGVEIMRDRGTQFRKLVSDANAHREAGGLLSMVDVAAQMERRLCQVELPEPHSVPLTDRQVWEVSRAAHVRVGWHYLCNHCDNWHQRLAGGFFISADGLVVTSQHVIDPARTNYREGYLVVASDSGELYPVREVLASDARTDVAIIRAAVEQPVVALPLQVSTYPGDPAWCYSDPYRRSGYFSRGMINRFYYDTSDDKEIVRMEVSTDWAPGSSGSAVVDQFGNAIGVVSQISTSGAPRARRSPEQNMDPENDQPQGAGPTWIVFRSASLAADVLALIGEEAAE
jgi:S1-C subfamily serine protease